MCGNLTSDSTYTLYILAVSFSCFQCCDKKCCTLFHVLRDSESNRTKLLLYSISRAIYSLAFDNYSTKYTKAKLSFNTPTHFERRQFFSCKLPKNASKCKFNYVQQNIHMQSISVHSSFWIYVTQNSVYFRTYFIVCQNRHFQLPQTKFFVVEEVWPSGHFPFKYIDFFLFGLQFRLGNLKFTRNNSSVILQKAR